MPAPARSTSRAASPRAATTAGRPAARISSIFVGSASLAAALGSLPAHVIVTQVVPHPLDSAVDVVREYRADLKTQEPTATPSFGSLEGYIATRILVTALERIPGPPTREGIVDALEGLGQFDLGLGETLKLGPRDHQACHRVWLTRFQNATFAPFPWAGIGELLATQRTESLP